MDNSCNVVIDLDQYFKDVARWRALVAKWEWQAKSPNHKRRTHLLKNGGTHTEEEWILLQQRYGGHCAYCGEIKPLTKDHIIPVSKGGSDDISNMLPVCRHCNCTKGNRRVPKVKIPLFL